MIIVKSTQECTGTIVAAIETRVVETQTQKLIRTERLWILFDHNGFPTRK